MRLSRQARLERFGNAPDAFDLYVSEKRPQHLRARDSLMQIEPSTVTRKTEYAADLVRWDRIQLSGTMARVLDSAGGGLTAAAISDRLGIAPIVVLQCLHRLLERGLVCIVPQPAMRADCAPSANSQSTSLHALEQTLAEFAGRQALQVLIAESQRGINGPELVMRIARRFADVNERDRFLHACAKAIAASSGNATHRPPHSVEFQSS